PAIAATVSICFSKSAIRRMESTIKFPIWNAPKAIPKEPNDLWIPAMRFSKLAMEEVWALTVAPNLFNCWFSALRATPNCFVLASIRTRSEEHTSELQSRENLVCRLLLEKKKKEERLHKTSYNR